jgi:hypothetical protein
MVVTQVAPSVSFWITFHDWKPRRKFKMRCGRVLNEGKKETYDQSGVVSQPGIDLLPVNKTP